MPICRSTVGALSRSRATSTFSASKTLVPFLYQTATILQRKPAGQPFTHRNLYSHSGREDAIPFDGEEALPPTIETYFGSRKTTITGSERAAFQKLYRQFGAEGSEGHEDLPFNHETDQIADEWWEEEDDKETGGSSLDAIFDAVLSGMKSPHTKRRSLPPGDNLEALAKVILTPESDIAKRKASQQQVIAELARVRGIRKSERSRVETALNNAVTDRELWHILEREVFGMLKKLDLDGMKKQQEQQGQEAVSNTKPSTKKITQRAKTSLDNAVIDPSTDPRILFPNFPSHLIFATRLYHAYFPFSTLPFSIIPTLKSLGRSSYALGATSLLYNQMLRTAWSQFSSFDYLDELLTDMENGGIDFDVKTLEILDFVLAEDARAHRGEFGPAVAHIWRTELFDEGSAKIRRWRELVAQRLGMWSQTAKPKVRAPRSGSTQTPDALGPEDKLTVDLTEEREDQIAARNRRREALSPKKLR